LWLHILDINIEDCVIYNIACGQSLAVTTILYQLYFKLENVQQYRILDNIIIKENEQLQTNNTVVDSCKSNSVENTLHNLKKKHKGKEQFLNFETSIFKLFNHLEGIQYTVIDVLKSKNINNINKGDNLDFIQHNMHCFYDLLMKNLNIKFFKNEFKENLNEVYKSETSHIEKVKEGIVSPDKLNDSNIHFINNFNLKTNIYNENYKLYNEYHIIQNDDYILDNCFHISPTNLINKNVTFNSLKNDESTITQSLDEAENKHFKKQDIFDEYLHHTGLWSSEYLNIDLQDCKQNILSMIVKEVLNFEYGESEITILRIKKTNIAGVIDIIQNTKVVQLVKDILGRNGILGFTTDDAVTACLNAYKEEIKISTNKGKLYQVLDEYEHQSITKTYSKNQKLENFADVNINGKYLHPIFF